MVEEVTLNSVSSVSARSGSVEAPAVSPEIGQDSSDKKDFDVNSDLRYFSPVIKIDTESQQAIFIFRDASTGETLQQFPPKDAAEAYENGGVVGEESDNVVSVSDEASASFSTESSIPEGSSVN